MYGKYMFIFKQLTDYYLEWSPAIPISSVRDGGFQFSGQHLVVTIFIVATLIGV